MLYKNIHLVAILTALTTITSCSVVESARNKLAEMPETEYQDLLIKVRHSGEQGGEKLSELLGNKASLALAVTRDLYKTIEEDQLNVADIVQAIVNEYSNELGLEEKHLEYVREGAKLIDAAVGQIRLGIDGKLSDREKELVLSLLEGLETGLQ